MEEEKQLTEQESLNLIASMITEAKCDYDETGVGALMWGILVMFCSLVTFANYYMHWAWADYVWFLTLFALIPQIIISMRESKKRKVKTYSDDAMGGIWISFAVALLIVSYYASVYQVPHVNSLFIVIYGIPTFATGYTRKFIPMIVGGIACWIFAFLAMYTPFPYIMLYSAAAALVAWFIPGLILRNRYLQLKKKNV